MRTTLGDIEIVTIYRKYGNGGYYVELATQALSNQEVTVRIAESLDLKDVITGRPGRIFHIHFPEELYKSWSGVLSACLAIRAICLMLVIRIRGAQIAWTCHDEMPHERSRWQWIDTWFRMLLARMAGVVFVHNEFGGNAVRRRFWRKANIVHVPHGNFIGFFPNVHIAKHEARTALGLSESSFVYLCFGRMRAYKGVRRLIHVFRNLPHRDARLVLAGIPAGPDWDVATERADLIHLTQGDDRIVTRLDWIPRDELGKYLSATDAAVFPFRQITTSGSVMVAMSSGIPVIVPSLGGVKELVRVGEGILFDAQDDDDLLRALHDARQCSLSGLSQAALRRAEEFQWSDFGRISAEALRGLAIGSKGLPNTTALTPSIQKPSDPGR